MTHDELLAKINIGAKFHGTAWSIDGSVDGLKLIKQSQALRAVVGLHKPEGINAPPQCAHDRRQYPGPTIQAIVKELK